MNLGMGGCNLVDSNVPTPALMIPINLKLTGTGKGLTSSIHFSLSLRDYVVHTFYRIK